MDILEIKVFQRFSNRERISKITHLNIIFLVFPTQISLFFSFQIVVVLCLKYNSMINCIQYQDFSRLKYIAFIYLFNFILSLNLGR